MLISCFCFLQEMYPPKVHQFAYVTDEACTEDEILSMEIIIMKVKNTQTSPYWWNFARAWYVNSMDPVM